RKPRMGPEWVVPLASASQRADWAVRSLRQAMPLLHALPHCVVSAVISSEGNNIPKIQPALDTIRSCLADPAAIEASDLFIASRPRLEARLGPAHWEDLVRSNVALTGQQDAAFQLLIEMIGEASEAKAKTAILVVGPSGSGKTTLGLRLLQRLVSDGFN